MGNVGISAARIWDKYGTFPDFLTKIWDKYETKASSILNMKHFFIDDETKYQIGGMRITDEG